MDISLHSFILVVGVLVIIFIVIDGIKKMRQAQSNPLEDDLLDQEYELPEDEPMQFDHLELSDDLLRDHFSEDQIAQPKTEQDESLQNVQEEEPLTFTALSEEQDDVVLEPFVAEEPKVNEPLSATKPQSDNSQKDVKSPKDDTAQKDKTRKDSSPLSEKAKAAAHSFKRHVQELKYTKSQLNPQSSVQQQVGSSKKKSSVISEGESVPVLMEPIELGDEVEPNPPEQQQLQLPEFVQQTLSDEAVYAEEKHIKADELLDEYIGDVVKEEPVGERLSERPPAEEIFVIHILKKQEPWLQGSDLQHIFKACDMRFGEMDIFHRFEQPKAQGNIQFSVVNSVEPGHFDPNTMHELETPGISLFMSLPGPENPMAAFDAMSEVALVFARNFNAQLQDESHSVLTPQTLEHYRQRIRDFTRRDYAIKK